MNKCLLVSPRFLGNSYWNYREVCELFDARYPAAPLGLVTKELAALGRVIWRLGLGRGTAWYFWRNLLRILGTRPKNFEAAVHLMALFLHFRKQTLFVLDGLERRIARLTAEPDDAPQTRPSTSTVAAAR